MADGQDHAQARHRLLSIATSGPPRRAKPPLTTVLQDTKRAGELLVDNLLKLTRGEPADNAILPVKLVVRCSTYPR